MKYSPQINIKTEYNFQESLIKIDDYLDFALSNNFQYAFYSDTNTMHGAAEFSEKFSKNDIKPIIGVTFEIELNQKITIGIYAKNKKGYTNISIIYSKISSKNMEVTRKANVIKEHITNDNIIIIKFENQFDGDLVNALFNTLDDENIYYGVDFKNKLNLEKDKIVFFDNINYFTNDDKEIYNLLLAIKNGETFDKSLMLDNHYYNDEELYLIIQYSQKNIESIANQINFNLFDNNAEIHLASAKTPNNISQKMYLRELLKNNLQSFFTIKKISINKRNEYISRMEYELKIIEEMNFVNYFLIVRDYVLEAKKRGIAVGPGRGSAAGSLVSFLLRITTIDPIEYGLLFERFLNPERKTMPDIDIDFQDTRRDEIIEYIFEEYGANRVATIVTYQTVAAKSAIRDVVRAYGENVDLANNITKLIHGQGKEDMKSIIASSSGLQLYYEKYPDIFNSASRIMGLPRQTGTHAAGIIISDVDLDTILPIKIGSNGIYQTQYSMEYLERLGLIKMDLLGLKNLTTLQEIQNTIQWSRNSKITFSKIDLNDPKVYHLLNEGKTTGIFQLESEGMTNLLLKMKVKNIEDISATSAIFRPGPKEMIPEYLKRRRSSNPVANIIDKSLTPILGYTNGIILYQEQVIQILQKVGNFSLGKADIVRRAMSKKNHEYMITMREDFINGALQNNYTKQKAEEIWIWIDKFAAYGFNKSHSIAYSHISYWLAYLKTYYPEEFYTSLFNSSIGNISKTNSYINEINSFGIDFKGPNIRNINSKFVSFNSRIFAPLTIIKGIGNEFLNKVTNLYETNKKDFDDLITLLSLLIDNGLTHSIFESLIWTGALDTYGYDRLVLQNNISSLMITAKANDLPMPILDESEKASEQMIYEKEFEYLGFYLSKNPFSNLRKEYKRDNVVSLNIIKNKTGIGNSIFTINTIRTKKDKNGKLMAFVEIQDDTEVINGTIFSSLYENAKDNLFENTIIEANIKIEIYNDKKSAVINSINKYIK